MQGVQVAAPALNDENSTLHGPATQLKRLSAAPLQPSKQGSVLKSSRKAFENITNNGKAPGSEASAAKAQPQQRRAFGDISNSAAKPPTGGVTTKKPQGTSSLFAGIGSKKAGSEAAPAPTPAQGSSQAVSVVAANAEANNTAWWEGLEPERPAGKTWEQLEDEREAALEADATRAADEIWKSVTGGGGLFKFLVPYPADDSEEEEVAAGLRLPFSSVPELSNDYKPVPEIASEDLWFPSDTDFATLLPDISQLSDGDGPEAGSTTADVGAVDHCTEDAADVAVSSNAGDIPGSSDSVSCSEAATSAAGTPGIAEGCRSPHIPIAQQASGGCRSPDVLPW